MRIKTADHNVPVPDLEDFELEPLPAEISCIPVDCNVAYDMSTRRLLARMFIEKARLTVCIGNVMSHYSVPEQKIDDQGRAKLSGLSMPRKSLDVSEIRSCHDQLQTWLSDLPDELKISSSTLNPVGRGNAPIVSHRALLHLVYYMTLATLHRPLPNFDAKYPALGSEGYERPRYFVRYAANRITDIAHSLLEQGHQRYLPTTGVTVLQPALISLLIDMKSPAADVRRDGLRGFCRCVHVLSKLRDCYSAADFTMVMVETSIRKAEIDVSDWDDPSMSAFTIESDRLRPRMAQSVEDLVKVGLRHGLVTPVKTSRPGRSHPFTPPAEEIIAAGINGISVPMKDNHDQMPGLLSDSTILQRLKEYLAPTPPALAPPANNDVYVPAGAVSTAFDVAGPAAPGTSSQASEAMPSQFVPALRDLDREFENLINTDNMTEAMVFGDGGFVSLQGESSGFFMDLDWMNGGAFGTPLAAAAPAAEETDLGLAKISSHQSVLSGFDTSVNGDVM